MDRQPCAGNLEKVALPLILRELYLNQATGILDLRQSRDQRRLILDDGDLRSVRSNRMEQRIGQHVLKNAVITRVQLMQALSSKTEQAPIGRTLVNLGYLTEEELTRQLEDLAGQIVFECIGWDSGEYHFQEGRAALAEDTEIRLSMGDLVFNGFLHHASATMARKMIDDLNSPLVPNPSPRLLFQHIALEDTHRRILDMIDGKRSSAELVSIMAGDATDNMILIGSLVACGLLSTRAREAHPSVLGFPQRNAPPSGPPPRRPASRPDPAGLPSSEAAHGPGVRRAAPAAAAAAPVTPPPSATTVQRGGDLSSPVSRKGSQYQAKHGLFKKKETKKVGLLPDEVERMRKSIRDKYSSLEYADHYQLLGVPLRATQKEIYYAFNMLCTLFHPDLARKEHFNDLKRELNAVFDQLEEAYETLVDADKRRHYDRVRGY